MSRSWLFFQFRNMWHLARSIVQGTPWVVHDPSNSVKTIPWVKLSFFGFIIVGIEFFVSESYPLDFKVTKSIPSVFCLIRRREKQRRIYHVCSNFNDCSVFVNSFIEHPLVPLTLLNSFCRQDQVFRVFCK